MQSLHTFLMTVMCAASVAAIYTSKRQVTHGNQFSLDLPERTEKLEFAKADESDQFIIWERRVFSYNKPVKGHIYSANDGWTYVISQATFEDEGTYILRNSFKAIISSYTLKVQSRREIINRVAGETLTIYLQGVPQTDASLYFTGNHSQTTLVENGVPVATNMPDYIGRVKVASDKIQILNVNVSDLGKYQLFDLRSRLVSNTTMLLVDHHDSIPSKGLIALILLGIPGTICFCCRNRICKRCKRSKTQSQAVESSALNPLPQPLLNPTEPFGPKYQVQAAGYPTHPDQGPIQYPPPSQWSGEPAASPNPNPPFYPEYAPQNPVYPPLPVEPQPPQWNVAPGPSPPVFAPVMSHPPSGLDNTGLNMNEPPPTLPPFTPQTQPSLPSGTMDVLNTGDSGVHQFNIDKGKSSGTNFL